MSRKLKGIAAAPGIAIAPIVQFHASLDQIPAWEVEPAAIAGERLRLSAALQSVAEGLARLQEELSGAIADHDMRIYDAQLAVLNDPTFRRDIDSEVASSGKNLEVAIQHVIERYQAVFESMDNPAMRERGADLRDIGRQLIGALLATERKKYTADGSDYVFGADEFLPSDAGLIDRAHIRGIVTAHGGKYSHGAILARSLGIPAVVGIETVGQHLATGMIAVIDGDAGLVVLNPDAEELADYEHRRREQHEIERRVAGMRLEPSQTIDGTHVRLFANVEGVRELDALEPHAIDGIGLFRTEFAFMERRRFPTEAEQVAMYRRAMQGAGGKPVTFRTLDVGGDKPLGYFRMPEERNPVLGWRGIRLCLDWPDILYTQMRAILRASALGHARILLPMITSRSEVVRCREVLDQLILDMREAGEEHDAKIELGMMVEIPAIVHILDDILPIVDFISVGTNDLVQYLLAVDRDNQRVAKMYDPFHPAVVRVLAAIARSARAANVPVSICGEVAGDHLLTPLLVGLGYRELSMAPVFLPRVKLMLRSFRLDECEDLAARALRMQMTREVRKLVLDEVQVRWSQRLGVRT